VWAEALRQLLEIKREVDAMRESGGHRLADDGLAALTTSYGQVVRPGLEANSNSLVQHRYGATRNTLNRAHRRVVSLVPYSLQR